tara:strand:- start:9485 stop:9979 length:495 start_codon:yes stop_codon:yes gene_type:complete
MAIVIKSRMSGDCKAIIINLEGPEANTQAHKVRVTHVPTGTTYKAYISFQDESYALNNMTLGGLYLIEVLSEGGEIKAFQYLVSTCAVDKCLVLLTDKLLSCGCTSPACSAILNKAQKVMLLIKSAEATAARIMREEDKVLVGDADSQYRKAVEMCEGNCDCGC